MAVGDLCVGLDAGTLPSNVALFARLIESHVCLDGADAIFLFWVTQSTLLLATLSLYFFSQLRVTYLMNSPELFPFALDSSGVSSSAIVSKI